MILTISPNPASDFIKIYSSKNMLNLKVYDASGKKMVSQRLTNGYTQINISRFAKGMYTITAESDGVTMETSKIMKQ